MIQALDAESLFFHTDNPICILSPERDKAGTICELRIVQANPAFCSLSGHVAMGGTIAFLNIDHCHVLKTTVERVIQTAGIQSIDIFLQKTKTWYRCKLIHSRSGNVIAHFSALLNNGSQQHIREQGPTDLRAFLETGPIIIVVRHSDGAILYANQSATDFYGWDSDHFTTMNIKDLDPIPQSIIAGRIKLARKEQHISFSTFHRKASGTIATVEVQGVFGTWNGENVTYNIITDRTLSMQANETAEPPHDTKQGDPDFRDIIATYKTDMPYIEDLFSRMRPYGKITQYAPGEHFLRFGENTAIIGFVQEGIFRQYTITEDGKDCTLGFYRPGSIVDSYAHIKFGQTNLIAFEARTPCLVFEIELKYLKPIVLSDNRWYRLFYYNMAKRLLMKYKRDRSLLCDDALVRYTHFTENEADIIPHIKKYHIASYLGITPETLSRIKRQSQHQALPSLHQQIK